MTTKSLKCESQRKICQDNLLLTEYSIELKLNELQCENFNRKYKTIEHDFELVWTIKKENVGCGCPSLILESCSSNDIFISIIIFTSQDGSSWHQQEDSDKSLFPDNLIWRKREIAVLKINNESHSQMKILLKIYSLNNNAFENINNNARNYDCSIKKEEPTNVTLIVGGEIFVAHKHILSKRSSVFASMFDVFTSDLLEKREGVTIEIEDIDAKTFKLLLDFIYTNQVATDRNTRVNWLELMLAADRYAIGSLKRICAWKLAEDLSVDNAIDFYILYDRFNEKQLKTTTADFIIANKSEIVGTKQYEKFISLYSDLAVELFRRIMSDEYVLVKK